MAGCIDRVCHQRAYLTGVPRALGSYLTFLAFGIIGRSRLVAAPPLVVLIFRRSLHNRQISPTGHSLSGSLANGHRAPYSRNIGTSKRGLRSQVS